MPYQATIVRVFIASPGDIPSERNLIRSIVSDWNSIHGSTRRIFLEAVGWETHSTPAMGDRPQGIINKKLLKDADLLIGVFWTRIGTATGDYASGTVEEIEEHLAEGKPAMIYFSDAPVRLESVDDEQYKALREFRKSLLERGLIESYDDLTDFAQKLSRHLAKQMNDPDFIPSYLGGDYDIPTEQTPTVTPGVSADALLLLAEAAKGEGRILMIRHAGGFLIQANRSVFDTSSPRLSARWKGAVEELLDAGYVNALGQKGEAFEVSDKGYKLFDQLQSSH